MHVNFDHATRDVTLDDGTRTVRLNLDHNYVETSTNTGQAYVLDSKLEMVRGRTMLPIGEIANILGFSRTDPNHAGGYLAWDGTARTVTIIVG